MEGDVTNLGINDLNCAQFKLFSETGRREEKISRELLRDGRVTGKVVSYKADVALGPS